MFADVPGAASTFEAFANCAENEPDVIQRGESPFPPAKSIVRREPYGVWRGKEPRNFPVLLSGWKNKPPNAAVNTLRPHPARFTSPRAPEMLHAAQGADIPPR